MREDGNSAITPLFFPFGNTSLLPPISLVFLAWPKEIKRKGTLMNLIKKLELEWLLIYITNFSRGVGEEMLGVDKTFP